MEQDQNYIRKKKKQKKKKTDAVKVSLGYNVKSTVYIYLLQIIIYAIVLANTIIDDLLIVLQCCF